MQSWQTVAISVAVAVFLIGLLSAWWIYRQRRSKELRQRFGPDYDHRIALLGSRRRAESALARNAARAQKLKSRSLSASDRAMFLEAWRLCQSRFADDPVGAVEGANRIIVNIMRKRGYFVDSPHDRQVNVCAAYPSLAASYREANEILLRQRRGYTSIRDLRKAFISFRNLFDEMLGSDEEIERAS